MKRRSVTKPKASESTRGRPGVRLKNILAPTDFSDSPGKAREYAAVFAAQFGVAITLLHIAEVGAMGYEHGADDFPRMEAQLRIAAEKQIVEAARELHSDLIIISTHGHTGLDHLIVGSTAERVVRFAPCPVLVVCGREHEFIATKSPRLGKSAA